MFLPDLSDIAIGCIPHGQWVARRAGVTFDPATENVLTRVDVDGAPRGGIVFAGFNGASIWMHMAGDGPWLNRSLIWAAAHYAFVQLRCRVVLGMVASTNELAMKIDLRLGFKEHSRIPGAVPRGDLVILSMRREDCRWLRLVPDQLAACMQGTSHGTV